MTEVASCRCDRWPVACSRTVTQEDLRCDVCRAGCSQMLAGPAGGAPGELRPLAYHFKTAWTVAFPEQL